VSCIYILINSIVYDRGSELWIGVGVKKK